MAWATDSGDIMPVMSVENILKDHNCTITGHSEVIGLGLRLTFYLYWLGTPIFSWLGPTLVASNHALHALTMLALSVWTMIWTRDNSLDTVEMYILALLTSGPVLLHMPTVMWRALSKCSPKYDPARFPAPPDVQYETLSFRIGVVVFCLGQLFFQIWFWTNQVKQQGQQDGTGTGCVRYGFAVVRVVLWSRAAVVVNMVVVVVVLSFLVVYLFDLVGQCWTPAPKKPSLDAIFGTRMMVGDTAVSSTVDDKEGLRPTSRYWER
jgi:hypothetical protein